MTEISNSPPTEIDERALTAAELKAAEDKLQSLCATHAATFVAVERRGGGLTASLKNLLSALNSSLPQVGESKRCLEIDSEEGKDGETLSSLAEKHRLRRRTLLQHSSLLELLELPSLMDACVRGHLYEEGLSIASFANTLERKHLLTLDKKDEKNNNTIVENVVFEVRKRESDLRRDLVNRLRSDVTMPQCLEIVTALRRLNGVELERGSEVLDLEKMHQKMEWQLQVNFLEARDIWLEGNSSMNNVGFALPNKAKKPGSLRKGSSEILLDSIDRYRTRCFEIATQFLAIFRSTATSSAVSDSHANQMLSMWTARRIHTFLEDHLASKCLPLISDTATLRDALESVSFFAASMGRVGADFSPLIQSIFEPNLVTIVTSHWAEGANVFENTLKVCRDTGIASPLHSSREFTDPLENEVSVGDLSESSRSKTPAPPRQLLALPPLARLVNAFLIGLNELRRCLLASTFPKVRSYFEGEFVKKVKSILLKNERVVLTPGFLHQKGEDAGKLRSVAMELKEEFDSCVEPYMTGAMEVALGSFGTIEKNAIEEGGESVILGNAGENDDPIHVVNQEDDECVSDKGENDDPIHVVNQEDEVDDECVSNKGENDDPIHVVNQEDELDD